MNLAVVIKENKNMLRIEKKKERKKEKKKRKKTFGCSRVRTADARMGVQRNNRCNSELCVQNLNLVSTL